MDPNLYRVQTQILSAWAMTKPRFQIIIRTSPGALFLYQAAGSANAKKYDIFSGLGGGLVDQRFVDLGPYLRVANFDPSEKLLSQAMRAFPLSHGAVRALPWYLSQWQFYVNSRAVTELGMSIPQTWTWADFTEVLSLAAEMPGRPPAVVGQGWADVSLWASVVLGLGGHIMSGSAIDLRGAVEATRTLVKVATRSRWAPTTQGLSFGGAQERAPFGMDGPWTSYDQPSPEAVLPVSAFPKFPVQPLVPAWYPHGWVVSPQCRRPDLAAEFLLWLYAPKQQRLLADLGIPPVVNTPDLTTYWRAAQAKRAATVPIVNLSRYFDVMSVLPPVQQGAYSYDAILVPALMRMAAGADVARELDGAQRQMQALVTAD